MSSAKLFTAVFVAFSITIILVHQPALAQGPGGVNNNLELWLDAGTGVTTAGASVSNWADQSGNGNDATQATAVNQPTNPGGVLNSQPVVRFDGVANPNNDYLTTGLTLNPFVSDFSIVTVSQIDNTIASGALVQQQDGAGTGRTLLYYDQGSGEVRSFLGGSASSASTYAANTPYINGVELSGTTLNFYRNNAADGTNGVTPETTVGNWLLGVNKNLNGQFFDGDMAEVIVFDTALINARRTIVNNYLSSKYAIAVSTDVYAGDTPGNGNYDFDVAGIGQESDGSHTAASSGGFAATDAGYLQDNGDYLMFGNDATTNANVTSDLPASGVDSRWARIFYLDKTDINSNGGNAQLTFDFSDSGLGGTPDGTSTYSLLYRAGTSGAFSVVSTASSISGDQVSFTEDLAGLSDGFYTLGVQAAPPVAIGGLTSFIEDETSLGIMPSAALPVVGGLGMVLAAGGVGIWLVYRRKR